MQCLFLAIIKSLLSRVQLVYKSITGEMIYQLDVPDLFYVICILEPDRFLEYCTVETAYMNQKARGRIIPVQLLFKSFAFSYQVVYLGSFCTTMTTYRTKRKTALILLFLLYSCFQLPEASSNNFETAS